MKKKIKYKANKKTIEREINYIPVRYIVAGFITLLEVLLILAVVIACCYFVPYFYILAFLTEISCVIKIISSDDSPEYKVPWLLFVLILPIAGFMLYFIFYSRKIPKQQLKRYAQLKDYDYNWDSNATTTAIKQQNTIAFKQTLLLENLSNAKLFSDTKTTYFSLGEDMWGNMLIDLENAKKFIFLEYFIIEEGAFWNSILETLLKKAKEGLDVRLVYDDIGCMSTLPGNYFSTRTKQGIKTTPFSRLKGSADGEFNNRSHRKITVIDGVIGYTGGVNIADEYVNLKSRFGHWKDVGIRLEGPAVFELTKTFITDFGINVKNIPQLPSNEVLYPQTTIQEKGFVMPFGDGPNPLYQRRVAKSLITSMLYSANEYAYIMTPYLIIDNDLCLSLENAALRGVDVRLILPHIPDKKIVFGITRSFYTRLKKAGVKIFEYTPGFVHAKVYLIDGKTAMVGTINLDYRSLVHHFENGVWMHETSCINDIIKDFDSTFNASEEMTDEKLKTSLFTKFIRSIVRIFAPLL